jgi:hypothetical protein
VVTNVLEDNISSIFKREVTLKMGASYSSESSVSTYQTVGCHNPEYCLKITVSCSRSNAIIVRGVDLSDVKDLLLLDVHEEGKQVL